MKKNILCSILFVFCVFSSVNSFARKMDVFDDFIYRGIKLTIIQQYHEAISTFDSLKKITFQDPRPYFYHAAALQARMLDYEDYSDQDEFFELITKSIELAENWISEDSSEAMGCFFKGASYSYRGFFHAQKKNYLKHAFRIYN